MLTTSDQWAGGKSDICHFQAEVLESSERYSTPLLSPVTVTRDVLDGGNLCEPGSLNE